MLPRFVPHQIVSFKTVRVDLRLTLMRLKFKFSPSCEKERKQLRHNKNADDDGDDDEIGQLIAFTQLLLLSTTVQQYR